MSAYDSAVRGTITPTFKAAALAEYRTRVTIRVPATVLAFAYMMVSYRLVNTEQDQATDERQAVSVTEASSSAEIRDTRG
jgi:hypothetical protein